MNVADVLDQKALKKLHELGRKAGLDDFLARMARTSLEEPPPFDVLHRALTKCDAETVGSVVHKMRGSFGTLGATRLVSFCGEMERFAAQGDLARCRARVDALEQEYQRVETALRVLSSATWAPSS